MQDLDLNFSGTFERELEVGARLAREAGKLILGFRDGAIEVDMKPGEEPVTAADRASSKLVVAGLSQAFASDIVVSEEEADDLRRLEAERTWFVDPLDGTKDFVAGREGFSVMIGLNINHRPTVGVVYQPVGNRLFAAAPDYGTWFFAPGEAPRKLQTSSTDDIDKIRLVASKSHREGVIDEVKTALGIKNEFNIGSVGLKLGLIALDERDLYVNPSSKCKGWDTCAPEAILHHAGGKMTDVHGASLRYDVEDTHHKRGLVASNGALHQGVIDRMAPIFPAERPL